MIKGIILSAQLMCLTEAIYHENRYATMENWAPQIKIAAVIHNRKLSKNYPDTYCEVISQASQFSYYHQLSDHTMYNKDAAIKAMRSAYAVYSYSVDGRPSTLFGGITHYHSAAVTPKWSRAKGVELVDFDGFHYHYTDTRIKFDSSVHTSYASTQ